MLAAFLVWHVLLADIETWPKFPKFGLRLTVYLALTLGLSVTSYYLIERPFLKLKDRFRAGV